MLIFLSKYWDFVDGDRNGSLDFLEFRKFWTDMIDIKTQRFFDVYDFDKNDIIEGPEITQLAINSKSNSDRDRNRSIICIDPM